MKKCAIAFCGLFVACFVLEAANAEAFFFRNRRSRTTVRVDRFDNQRPRRVSRREVRREMIRQRESQQSQFNDNVSIQVQSSSNGQSEQLLIPDAPIDRRSGCTGGRCVQNCNR